MESPDVLVVVSFRCSVPPPSPPQCSPPDRRGPVPPIPGRASTPDHRSVHFGDADRALVTPADDGRQVLQPLPRPDGTTPGLIVTSDGRSTTVEASDSDAAPVLVDGTPRPSPLRTWRATDELVELRFEVIGRDGRPGLAHINVFDVDDAAVSAYRRLPGDPDAECTAKPSSPAPCILVPPGTYSLMGLVKTMAADQPSDEDQSTIQNLSLVGDPEVEVTEDRTFTFDARRARRIEVRTPGARTTTNENGAMELGYYRTAANGQSIKVWQRPGSQLDQNFYMEPTATVRTGGLQTLTRIRLEAPAIELDAPRTDDLHPEYFDASWFSDFSSSSRCTTAATDCAWSTLGTPPPTTWPAATSAAPWPLSSAPRRTRSPSSRTGPRPRARSWWPSTTTPRATTATRTAPAPCSRCRRCGSAGRRDATCWTCAGTTGSRCAARRSRRTSTTWCSRRRAGSVRT